MLKKGSLLSKGEQRNFIYLTIGNPSGYDNYGYRNDPSYIEYKTGAIDRIPYWEWEGNAESCRVRRHDRGDDNVFKRYGKRQNQNCGPHQRRCYLGRFQGYRDINNDNSPCRSRRRSGCGHYGALLKVFRPCRDRHSFRRGSVFCGPSRYRVQPFCDRVSYALGLAATEVSYAA